jgi:Zinc carboxypeptidase
MRIAWFSVGGSSKVACTDTYSGPVAFSEKEARALMDFFATIADKAEAYVSFHSAAQLLLYPMGHTGSSVLVPNVDDLVIEFCKKFPISFLSNISRSRIKSQRLPSMLWL